VEGIEDDDEGWKEEERRERNVGGKLRGISEGI